MINRGHICLISWHKHGRICLKSWVLHKARQMQTSIHTHIHRETHTHTDKHPHIHTHKHWSSYQAAKSCYYSFLKQLNLKTKAVKKKREGKSEIWVKHKV